MGRTDCALLCAACWRGCRWIAGGQIRKSFNGAGLDSVRAAGVFEGNLREAIHAYKFGRKASFRRPFTALLEGLAEAADLVAWPPSLDASLTERGFDSAGELAGSVAGRLKLPLFRGLRRSRQGEKQVSLGREQRWANAEGAYEADASFALQGAAVLLVDDVITTGATLNAAALALKAAGAARVSAVTLASGELRGN